MEIVDHVALVDAWTASLAHGDGPFALIPAIEACLNRVSQRPLALLGEGAGTLLADRVCRRATRAHNGLVLHFARDGFHVEVRGILDDEGLLSWGRAVVMDLVQVLATSTAGINSVDVDVQHRSHRLAEVARLAHHFETVEASAPAMLRVLGDVLPLGAAVIIVKAAPGDWRTHAWVVDGVAVDVDVVREAARARLSWFADEAVCDSGDAPTRGLAARVRSAVSEVPPAIILPLAADGLEVLGVLALSLTASVGADDVMFAAAFTEHLALAVVGADQRHADRAARYECEAAARRCHTLHAIAVAAVAAPGPLESVLRAIVETTRRVLGVDAAVVLLVDHEGGRRGLRRRAVAGFKGARDIEIGWGEGVEGGMVLAAGPRSIDDVRAAPGGISEDLAESGLRALCGAPLRTPAGVTGAIYVANRAPGSLGDAEAALIDEVAALIAPHVDRVRFCDEQLGLAVKLDTIGRVSAAVAAMPASPFLDAGDVVQQIAHAARMVTGACYAAVSIAAEAAHPAQVAISGCADAAAPLLHSDGFVRPLVNDDSGRVLRVVVQRDERALGEIVLAKRVGAPGFTSSDAHAIELLATHTAVAVGNERLACELRRGYARFRTLADAGRAFAGAVEVSQAARSIVEIATQLADVVLVDVKGATVSQTEQGDVRLADLRIADEVLRTNRARLIRHVGDPAAEDVMCPLLRGWVRARRLRSVAVIPLSGRDGPVGTFAIAMRHRDINDDDVVLAEELGRRAASAIENARLHHSANHAIHSRDLIASMIAHDLRNPLSGIALAAEQLRPATDGDRRCLGVIHRSTARMVRLIGDLADVAAIESRQLRLQKREEDIAEIVAEAVAAVVGAGNRVQVRAAIARPGPRVACDRDRILQILGNLLDNAVKFSPPDGSVAVATEYSDGAVHVVVSDEGPGIGPDDVPHLFELHWQAPATAHLGRGLGLYIAKSLVDSHGGSITVDGAPPGARFTVHLPCGSEP